MIGLLALLAAASPMPETTDAVARQFLTTFVGQPDASKAWFAKDATIVFGDIGGTVSQSLRVLQKTEAAWMRTCQVASLVRDAAPPADQLVDAPPQFKRGPISVFSGDYSCARAGNAQWHFKFKVAFVGDRVAMLTLGGGPNNG